jgi:hypothetical protein
MAFCIPACCGACRNEGGILSEKPLLPYVGINRFEVLCKKCGFSLRNKLNVKIQGKITG